MWKKIRYIFYVAAVILAFAVTYNARRYYYIPFIQDKIGKATDFKLKFADFSVGLFPPEISVYGIEYDNKLFIDKTTLRFEPLTFFKNIKAPLKSLAVVDIDRLDYIDSDCGVVLPPASAAKTNPSKLKIKIIKKIINLFDTDIFIKKSNIIYKNALLRANDANINVSKKTEVTAFLTYGGHDINVKGGVELTDASLTGAFDFDVCGVIKTISSLTGRYNFSDGSFYCAVDTKQLAVDKFTFGSVQTNIQKNDDGLTVDSAGDCGSLSFYSPSGGFDVWSSSGSIFVRDSGDIINTRLEYFSNMKDGLFTLSLKAKDTKLFGSSFGTLDVFADNDDGRINLSCYPDTNNRFKAVFEKDGGYTVDVYTKKLRTGQLVGNYKTGEVSVDMKNVPVTKLPFLSSFGKKVKGTISLYGNIGRTNGSIALEAKNISSAKLKQFDTFGEISKEDSVWKCDIATKDKKLSVKGFYQSKQHYKAEFFYSGVDVENLLKILGFKPQVSGFATGYVKYDSNLFTQVDVSLKKGSLLGNKFNKWEIAGDMAKTKINISTFSFRGADSSLNLKALFDFTEKAEDSFLSCDIENFKIGGVKINSRVMFNGKITDTADEIDGKVNIPALRLNDFCFDNFSSDVRLSLRKLFINNFGNKNGLSGNLEYDFKTKNISSGVKITRAQISKHYNDVKGFLSSVIRINGSVLSPEIECSAKIKEGVFLSVNFSADAEIILKNKTAKIKKLKVTADDKNKKTVINVAGAIDKNKANMAFDFEGVSEGIINDFMGFKTPLEGVFYGKGKVSGSPKNLKYAVDLSGDTLYVKSVKLHALKSKIEINKNVINLKEASVKLSDSEINILSGRFDTDTGQYRAVFKLVNTHLGPFDLFGNINFTGKMTKRAKDSTYKGSIEFDKLWINRKKINSLNLDYYAADKKFAFKSRTGGETKISGALNFCTYPKIQFEKINISQDSQSCKLHGYVKSGNLNVDIEGKLLDSSLLTGIFDLPFEMDGKLNIVLKASGDISKPDIFFSLKSKKGSIEDIPYGIIDIDTKVKNNVLHINKFLVEKNGEYAATLKGYFPFWLDPALEKQMMNRQVSVNYEIVDDKLAVLKSIFGESINVKKGSFKMRGTLSGIRKNISNTGSLKAEASNITTDSYISKIKSFYADVRWRDSLFKIEKLEAKAGSGTLNAEGEVRFKGLSPSFYDLSVFTSKKGIPIVIRELPIPTSGIFKMEKNETFTNFSKGTPVFNFKLYGARNDLKLTGRAELKDTRFCFPSPVETANDGSVDIEDILGNLKIDIDLVAASDTRYENTFADMFLRGGINLKGSLDEITANGIIESDEGRLSYLGNDFDVVKTKLEVINNEIYISGEADAEVYSSGESEGDIIKVFVDRSDIKNIKTRFASKNDPTMDSKKALAKLTKTDPTQTSALDTSTDFLIKQQAIRLFGSSIAMPLANTVLKKTGIVDNVRLGFVNQDTLQISSNKEPTLAELLYGMKYSVEKNVNRLIQIGYSLTFDQIQREIDLKHALEMSFKLNRDLFLKGSYGLQSDNPLYEPEKKIMIEQRLRFGGSSK